LSSRGTMLLDFDVVFIVSILRIRGEICDYFVVLKCYANK